MKNSNDIEYIYEKLSALYPNYSNKKPKAKIYSKAYTSLIGVMLSAQSQDKRTAVACRQLFALADTPEAMLKLSQEEIIEAIKRAFAYSDHDVVWGQGTIRHSNNSDYVECYDIKGFRLEKYTNN